MANTIIESLFQRSLEDMVKGLRVQMIGEAAFLSKALDEVRKEIKSMDVNTKSVALQKLTYLNMLQGTDMAWASFQVVEVMSMQKFSIKKLGYLAASQSFNESTDVLLLITNLLRKDFGGKNEYEASLAIECLSRVATSDLARDLLPELFTMLGSSRALVRKKATVALTRVFIQYPDAIRVALKRLIERLGDSDPSVVTAAISVLCDLAVKDPRPFLPLAPELYNLLVRSPNNWLCIKLVKILGFLAPLEPRLAKKIADPICELMRKSEAKSLLLECIQTVTSGLTEHRGAVTICIEKLNELMGEDDTNLKYLCLRALANLMPVHPWAVAANKEAIAKCLNHRDPSIQKGARRLIIGMVSESNVMATVHVLLQYAHNTDAGSSNELVSDILSTCSSDNYDLISDFSWYVSVLAEMARIPHCECGDEIGRQLIDIGFRVKSATGEVLRAGRDLLVDPALLDRVSIHGVLSAAAWIAGEYVAYSSNLFELVQALLQPRTILLPASVRALYVQAVFKVFVYSSAKFYGLESSIIGGRRGEDNPYAENSSLDQDLSEAEVIDGDSPISESQNFTEIKLGDPATNRSLSSGESTSMKGPFSLEAEESSLRDNSNLDQNQANQGRKLVENDRQHESGMKVGEERQVNADGHLQEKGTIAEESQSFVEFLQPMIELITENMTALVTSSDVEVQERACNLLGLVQVMKDISTFPWPDQRDSLEDQDFNQLLGALLAVFSLELSPISVHAQGRVTAPEGIILENLDALGPLQNDQEVVKGILGRDSLPEWEERKVFSFQNTNNSPVGESAALLAQHRQRHQKFYLPSEEKLVNSSLGYPPPLVSYLDSAALPYAQSASFGDDAKPSRAKARPVVVRLDDDHDHSKSPLKVKKKDLKDEFISSAIMDVLAGGARSAHKDQVSSQGLGEESVRTRRHRSHGSRSSRHSGKDSSLNHQTSSRVKDAALEQGSSGTFEMDGSPSIVDQGMGISKSIKRHRHPRHERKAVSVTPGVDVESQATKSPRSPQRRSRHGHAGDHKAASPGKELNAASPVLDFNAENRG